MTSLPSSAFHTQVPPKPSGRYAHIVMLRITDSYPLFQTDGELNTARVSAGATDTQVITRLTMFKRKQTTPERLAGRELLRRYGFISGETVESNEKRETDADGLPLDEYNVSFCQWTPDAISYGYAIGDSGSERSKVLSDTCYSLTPYDDSHEAFTLNAPYETGTMSQRGSVTSRINEQDHVRPQVIFPSVLTTRDLTYSLFRYVLNNVLRTKRYGAQTTRTGRMENQLVALVFADGEVFSNLKFTQRLYDELNQSGDLHLPDPVDPQKAMLAAKRLVPTLLSEDGVVSHVVMEDDLTSFVQDLQRSASTEDGIKEILQAAFDDSKSYHDTWLAKSTKGKK